MGEVSLPLTEDSTTSIPTERNICKGAVLCLDFHPKQRFCLRGQGGKGEEGGMEGGREGKEV